MKAPKTYIKAMKQLVERYKKAIEIGISKAEYESLYGMNCLLCTPKGLKRNFDYYYYVIDLEFKESCVEAGCPWMVITGDTCTHTGENSGFIYHSTDKDRQRARVEQLKQWVKEYERWIYEHRTK